MYIQGKMKSIEFLDTNVDIGIIEPNSKAFVNFRYEGDKSEMVYIHKHCGCTGEHIHLESPSQKTLQFVFKESDVKHLTQMHVDNYYPDGKYPFEKTISVYLTDDQPLKVENPDKPEERILNKQKKHIDINFTGIVDISNLKFP
jgi:hypothetical protein